jgi:hypothetical protein
VSVLRVTEREYVTHCELTVVVRDPKVYLSVRVVVSSSDCECAESDREREYVTHCELTVV